MMALLAAFINSTREFLLKKLSSHYYRHLLAFINNATQQARTTTSDHKRCFWSQAVRLRILGQRRIVVLTGQL